MYVFKRVVRNGLYTYYTYKGYPIKVDMGNLGLRVGGDFTVTQPMEEQKADGAVCYTTELEFRTEHHGWLCDIRFNRMENVSKAGLPARWYSDSFPDQKEVILGQEAIVTKLKVFVGENKWIPVKLLDQLIEAGTVLPVEETWPQVRRGGRQDPK